MREEVEKLLVSVRRYILIACKILKHKLEVSTGLSLPAWPTQGTDGHQVSYVCDTDCNLMQIFFSSDSQTFLSLL